MRPESPRPLRYPFSGFLLCGLAAMAATFGGASSARAQTAPIQGHWEPYTLHSGNWQNPYPVEMVVYRGFVTLSAGTPWVRLQFTRAQLAKGSRLRISALADGDVQTLDQTHLEQWEYGTAFFNGHSVMLEIIAGPETLKNYFEIDKVWAGDLPGTTTSQEPETICGSTDNRVPSSNAAVGRLLSSGLGGGCTGWIIDEPSGSNDKCHLAAGHCFPGSAVLQFNVPSSNSNCSLVHPPASRQFAVNAGTMVAVNGGLGNDYAVFRCFPNPNTGLTTFQAQGAAITLAGGPPSTGATVRITGFGTDGSSANNAGGANGNCSCFSSSGTGQRNQVQQTNTGPYSGTSGTRALYQVDTCGGNSGSPVFNASTGQAFAIHTNGGCGNPVGGTSNSGTLVTSPGVQNAILAVCGSTGNNTCATALAVVDGTNGPFSNVGSTTSPPSWPCASGGNDVWFSYVATCSGNATFDTCTPTRTYDTAIQVFSGFCGNLTSLGCNDDSCGFGSSLTVGVTAGVRYYIRVGGFSGATGSFDLRITGCSSADTCVGAVPLALGPNGPFTNQSATTSPPAWPCGAGANDVWFRYDVPCPSVVTFTTCSTGTNYDTTLQVFSGSCSSLTSLACNDDSSCAVNGLFSRASVAVSSPQQLLVRVGGFSGRRGNFVLDVSLTPANDECTTAMAVTNGTNGPFCNLGATTSSPWPCAAGGSDVWFSYQASCNGTLVVDTCSPTRNYDTALQVFSGNCANLTSLGCNDDACGLGSSLSVPVAAGQNYFIRVGGFVGAQGMFDLTLSCTPANDECSNAITVVDGVNGPFSNVGATTSMPPWPCGAGGRDVWFSYRATCTAPATFRTCTPARTYDTTIEVFSGSCANLTSLACNDDSCGLGSSVTVPVVLGQVYLVRVGGFASAQGSFELEIVHGTGTGSFTSVPTGCGPTTITPTGSPNIGGSLTFTLGNVVGLPFFRLGFNQINQPFCPPTPCRLGPDNLVSLFGRVLNLPVPCNPAFIGISFGVQGADLVAPGGCPTFNLTVTDTIIVTIG